MATITRADVLTGTKRQLEFFSDFTTNFSKTPFGNQLAKVSNERAINQALRNLIKTNVGERMFQPTIGSDVMATLFELDTLDARNTLIFFIENAINNHEKRVNLLEVEVKTVETDENALEISITYNLINNPEPINLSMILKRVR